MKKIERTCITILFIIALIFAGWLGYMSLKWSQVLFAEDIKQYLGLYLYKARDHVKHNIAFCVIVFALNSIVILLLKKRITKQGLTTIAGLEAGLIFLFCYTYTVQMQSIPVADSQQIISIAYELSIGNKELFNKGDYLALYPHQVGLAYFVSILMRLFPNGDIVFVFQMLNCLGAAGIVYVGYQMVERLWNRISINMVYLLVQGLFLPLMFYSVFVYGEILHIFAIMLFFSQIMKIEKEEYQISWWSCMTAIVALSFAMLIRMNTLIVAIATIIVSLMIALFEKKKSAVIVLLCTFFALGIYTIFPWMVMGKHYTEEYSYPRISWIYMGTLDGSGFGYGSYDGTVRQMFEEVDFDKELGKDKFEEALEEKLSFWKQNPDYMLAFQKEKLLWQWCTPCYKVFDTNRFHKEGYPQGVAYDIAYGKYQKIVYDFMDSYQSFIYISFILGMIMLLKTKESFMSWIWTIIFIGGIGFSILWEASPRYVLPYMVFIIPCCAYGIAALTESVLKKYL